MPTTALIRLIFAVLFAIVLVGAPDCVNAHPPHEAPSGSSAGRAESAADMQRLFEGLTSRLEMHPEDAVAWVKLGSLHLRRARAASDHTILFAAEQAFRRALEIEPKNGAARAGLAHSLLGRHQFRSALKQARIVARHHADEPEAIALLADAHLALGNDAEAYALIEQLNTIEISFQGLIRQAFMAQHRGQLSRADVLFHDALDAAALLKLPNEDRAWCHTVIGEFDIEYGRVDDGLVHLRAALALDPETHHAIWLMARTDLERGNVQAAKTALEGIVGAASRPAYVLTLADACESAGDTDRAQALRIRVEETFRAELKRDDIGHAREYVEFLIATEGDADFAVELALRDLHDVRQDADAFATAAWAMHGAGDHAGAWDLMSQALARCSSRPRMLKRAAEVARAAGHDRQAALLERSRQSLLE